MKSENKFIIVEYLIENGFKRDWNQESPENSMVTYSRLFKGNGYCVKNVEVKENVFLVYNDYDAEDYFIHATVGVSADIELSDDKAYLIHDAYQEILPIKTEIEKMI